MNEIRGPAAGGRSTRRERVFEFPLNAVVRGRDLRDRDFVEEARLATVSALEARLCLKPAVRVGAKLSLSFSVPARAWLERSVHLDLAGTVSRVETGTIAGGPAQWVTLRLDKRYRISAPGL